MPRDSCQRDSSLILNNSILITHSRPSLDEDDIYSVVNTLRSNNIAQGIAVAQFENAMCDFIGIRGGAVAVNSGTSALHLSLLALNIKEGDEVMIPSYVCSALLNAIMYVKAKTCFVDIDPESYNIDTKDLKNKIRNKTKLIIVPHLFGLSADMKEIVKYGIPVIEDGAQSIGALYQGRQVGNLGIACVLSFYATKVITTGEGGMILSNSEEMLNKIRDLRDYDEKKHFKVRFNYKLTDFQASLGISQLKKLTSWIEKRRQIAKRVFRRVENSKKFDFAI